MGSVSLGVMSQVFKMADMNGNGTLDRPEIAKEALAAFGAGDTAVGSMLGTLVLGGLKGNGLFPDGNGDNQLSFDEMTQFAALSGDPNGITPDDFTVGFGSQSVAGGQPIDLNRLQGLASQAVQTFNIDLNDPESFASGLDAIGANTDGSGIDTSNLMTMIFAMLLGKS